MKKILALILGVSILFPTFGGNAEAAYLPEYDKYIEIKTSHDVSQYLNEDTARLSFAIQERLIAEYERKTGTTFDHYYIWITVNGVKVLGIDPPVAMY